MKKKKKKLLAALVGAVGGDSHGSSNGLAVAPDALGLAPGEHDEKEEGNDKERHHPLSCLPPRTQARRMKATGICYDSGPGTYYAEGSSKSCLALVTNGPQG